MSTPASHNPNPVIRHRSKMHRSSQKKSDSVARKKLVKKFPTKSRKGMAVSVDSAFQKRGYNSLTGTHMFCCFHI